MKKIEALKIIRQCALKYNERYLDKNLLFVFGTESDPECFEAVFQRNNFLHLTGVKPSKNNSSYSFYNKAVNNMLTLSDFEFDENGLAKLKLEILNRLLDLDRSANMVGVLNSIRPLLITEKLVGNIYCCMGFVKYSENKAFYVPNTALKEDTRNITVHPQKRVLTVLKKNIKDELYKTISYTAKNTDFKNISFNCTIKSKISNDLFT